MNKELIPLEKILQYQMTDLENIYEIETTAGQLEKHFTVNLSSPISFISKFNLPHLRTEEAKTSHGFRKIYSAKELINYATSIGKHITKPKHEIEKIELIEKAKSQIGLLETKANELNLQISEKEEILLKINRQLNIAFKRYNQAINEPLLDEDEILFLAGISKRKCGVYFLIKDEEIIYVGQSVNIEARIHQHRSTKSFDRFTYIECNSEDLNKIETMYINKLKPKLNYNSLGRLVLPMNLEVLQYNIDMNSSVLNKNDYI